MRGKGLEGTGGKISGKSYKYQESMHFDNYYKKI